MSPNSEVLIRSKAQKLRSRRERRVARNPLRVPADGAEIRTQLEGQLNMQAPTEDSPLQGKGIDKRMGVFFNWGPRPIGYAQSGGRGQHTAFLLKDGPESIAGKASIMSDKAKHANKMLIVLCCIGRACLLGSTRRVHSACIHRARFAYLHSHARWHHAKRTRRRRLYLAARPQGKFVPEELHDDNGILASLLTDIAKLGNRLMLGGPAVGPKHGILPPWSQHYRGRRRH